VDTLTFLQTILPETGFKFVVLFKPAFPYPIHRSFDSLADMAEAIANYNRDPAISAVYHACASYKLPYVEVEKAGKTKKQFRKPNNWRSAKSFWLDLDCGQEKFDAGAGYLTKKDAATAVAQFARAVGWPTPMLVSSGNGLHAYWPLTMAVNHTSWTKCADLLKAAAALYGLIADPTRTADFASILRPAGTLNRKDPANPGRVKVLKECEPQDAKALYESIKAYAATHDVVLPESALGALPAHLQGADLNADLTGHLPYANVPVNADDMADKCKQVGAMRNTAGDVPYDHWRGVVGLLTHCEDGRSKAEDWSSERDSTGHDNLDWATRYDSWDAGPTTCEYFSKCSPDGCVGCEWKGKVNTPLVLGRIIPITVEQEVEVATATEEVEVVTIPAYPQGYQWNNGLLSRILPDKDGINQVHSFTPHQFYPTMRIRGEDGAYKIGLRMHLHNNRIRDFQMPFEAMASSTDVLKSLAKYELMQTNHPNAGVHLTAYLRDSLEQLKRRVEETNTLTSFGWKDEMRGFLIGDRYYTASGVKRVLLGGYAAQKQAALTAPQGTLAGYAKPLNYVYNRDGMESLQYAICSGWGSILNPFCEELYCGLLLAITGGDSGKGKSTVAYASVYAFGDSNAMALKSDDAGTRNALWATVGAFNNLPLIFDELTGVEADWFSNFTYTLSLGEERARLQSTGAGVKFANQSSWRMSPFGTANKDLHGVLAATQANSQAEAVRMVQIHVDSYPIPKLEETEVQTALAQMKANRGTAGAALIQYAVAHTEQLFERIRAKVSMLVEHIPGTKYRFYRSHAACTLVAAEIAVELGVCEFDVEKMTEFSITLMQKLAKEITVNNTVTSEDAFSRMVASLTPGIVVTSEYRDSRSLSGVETPRNSIRGSIVGRYVLGTKQEAAFAGRLFLCQKSMREWCMKNRTDFQNVLDHLRQAGALVHEDERITLTRGTDLPRVQQRCVIVDLTKLEASGPVLVVNNTQAPGSQSAV
jgi:uncharacterized protein (DUF927 family)